jgi:hypothetical protein
MSDNPRTKRTMRGTIAARDQLIKSVADLLGVASSDMVDEWEDGALEGVFHEPEGAALVRNTRTAGRFAEKLVDRLLFDDDVLLEYVGTEEDDDAPWNEPLVDDDGIPDRYLTPREIRDQEKRAARAAAIAHANQLTTGGEVVRISDPKRVKSRGTVSGRDADDPTRILVNWGGPNPESWHDAADLRPTMTEPEDYPTEDPMQTEYPTDAEPTEEPTR